MDTKRALESWTDEMNSAYLYRSLADAEKDARLAEVYRRMADVEVKHAEKWAAELVAAGAPLPEFKPLRRAKILAWVGRRFGAGAVLPGMANMEREGAAGYSDQPEMSAQERSHARILGQISGAMTGGMDGGTLAQMEGRHRTAGGNALRAAVMGANDGLVSNLSLVMGVSGAMMSSKSVLITGLAGLLAGAFSMALGEWLSVQSSRELYENQIAIEADEIRAHPEEEAEELALIYEARGLKPESARMLADQILSDENSALDTLAREELGMDPKELGGSAWEAALTSFVLFTAGAIVPVFPFIFLSGWTAVIASIALSGVALFAIGAIITLFTGRGVLYSGMRMVIFGLLAAAATFLIGRLIGVGVVG